MTRLYMRSVLCVLIAITKASLLALVQLSDNHQLRILLSALIIAPDASVSAVISVEYQDFRVRGTLNCPYSAHMWQTPSDINIMAKSNLADVSNTVPISK